MKPLMGLCLMFAVVLVLIPSAVRGCSCYIQQKGVLENGLELRQTRLEAGVCDSTNAFLRVYVNTYVNNGDDYEVLVRKVFKGPGDLQNKKMIVKADRKHGSLCGLSTLLFGYEYFLEARYDKSSNTLSAGLCNYHIAITDPTGSIGKVSEEDVNAALNSYWCGDSISPETSD